MVSQHSEKGMGRFVLFCFGDWEGSSFSLEHSMRDKT